MNRKTFSFELCSINISPIYINAISVSLPTSNGVITILPNHTPLITSLEMGIVTVQQIDNDKRFFAIMGGIAQISQNNVSIFTNVFEEGTVVPKEEKEFSQWTKEITYAKKQEEEQIRFYLLKTIKKWKDTRKLSETK